MLWGMNIVDSLFLSYNAMVSQKRHNGQNITGQVIMFCSVFIIQAVAAVQLVVHCCTPSSWATDNAAGEWLNISAFCSCSYLIFVISFTQARFLENKIYTEERENYDKRISRKNSVNHDLLGQANDKDQDYTKFVTLCVKLHTECKSTLGLCKNKNYTKFVKLHIHTS